ncbi:hypothetical protein RJ639_022782 [Escallonia herrerae]|uniref:Syntaxin 6/10/61 N-terminal domain-containing protein n=1 Tax=Escallonia herrerae TaxID=1293975 RepID=A0AA89ADQ7_9ASTE|nr:hypothetical protein RJ639_022782 [Escallonia herrerae]
MATHFDRWEKDPFFSAAEEVQESADRMESTYRTWIHAVKDSLSAWNSDELRRDLHTALGTTKWQLEEFERAVRSSYSSSSVEDAKDRHRDFIIAMESQISKVESSLQKSAVSAGKPPLPWVRLDEGESKELALFLSGPASSGGSISAETDVKEQQTVKPLEADKESAPQGFKNMSHSSEWDLLKAGEDKLPGHRRTASAGADIGTWKIAVSDDVSPKISSNAQPEPPPRKIPSFSGFLNTMESASKSKWSKNGYRKLKLPEHHQDTDAALLQSQHLTRGIDVCIERNKSCLDGCDDCYDKQIYGWYGALQRQLQRSQYQMQYSRPIQVLFWTVLLLCFIGELARTLITYQRFFLCA